MDVVHRSLLRRSRTVAASMLAIAVLSLGALLATGQEGTPSPVDATCVPASPRSMTSTPTSAASPTAHEVSADDAPKLGTPTAGACLMVTLRADETMAGPRSLTVEVLDPDGAPVTDADVIIRTRHLEMDHGTSTTQAVATGPGLYVAERVAMGMGGTWQAEIVITRPGYEPVVVTYVIALEGHS